MKIVMTLVVRDEADILDDQLRYHLEHGVDFVLATDHRSSDGTMDILRRYERDGVLRLSRETGPLLHQSDWVTRMARLAATELGADWVIHSDADEFWWPREGPLREVLAAVPRRYGVIRGLQRHFLPRPETGAAPFYERMVVRPRRPNESLTTPFGPQVKIVHRSDPNVVVGPGNHDATSPDLVLVREWFPLEVLHFPIRTRAQMERKYLRWEDIDRADRRGGPHIEAMINELHARSAEEIFDEHVVTDEALTDGLKAGDLTLDTRLRDALRLRAGDASTPCSPDSLQDDAGFVEELHVMQAMDSVVRLSSRVASVERRLDAVERSSLEPVMRLLRRGSAWLHR